MMHLDVKEGSTLIQKELRTLNGHSRIKMTYLNPSYVSDVPAKAGRQRSHPMHNKKCKSTGDLPSMK